MKILLFLLPLAGLLLILMGAGFVWAVRSKQFDDLEGPAYRILFDEDDGPLGSNHCEENTASIHNQVVPPATGDQKPPIFKENR